MARAVGLTSVPIVLFREGAKLRHRATASVVPVHSDWVENLSPLLAGKVEIEVAEWADSASGQWKLPRHVLDETRINEHIATLDLAERSPRRVAISTVRGSDVDANPDVTDSHT
jgi:hypothetical protein